MGTMCKVWKPLWVCGLFARLTGSNWWILLSAALLQVISYCKAYFCGGGGISTIIFHSGCILCTQTGLHWILEAFRPTYCATLVPELLEVLERCIVLNLASWMLTPFILMTLDVPGFLYIAWILGTVILPLLMYLERFPTQCHDGGPTIAMKINIDLFQASFCIIVPCVKVLYITVRKGIFMNFLICGSSTWWLYVRMVPMADMDIKISPQCSQTA